jgi:hypothetical protein
VPLPCLFYASLDNGHLTNKGDAMSYESENRWDTQTDLLNGDCARFMLATNELAEIMNTDTYLEPQCYEDGTLGLFAFYRGWASEGVALALIVIRDAQYLVINPNLIKESEVLRKIRDVAISYDLMLDFSTSDEETGFVNIVPSHLKEKWSA